MGSECKDHLFIVKVFTLRHIAHECMVVNEPFSHFDQFRVYPQFIGKDFEEGSAYKVMVPFPSFAGIMQKNDQFEHGFFICVKICIECCNERILYLFERVDRTQRVNVHCILVIAVELWKINHFSDRRDHIFQQSGIGECAQNGVGMRLIEDRAYSPVECVIRTFRPL